MPMQIVAEALGGLAAIAFLTVLAAVLGRRPSTLRSGSERIDRQVREAREAAEKPYWL